MRFLLVDRILHCSPQEVRGLKHITPDDYYLSHTAQGDACFTTALVGEALGQLAAWSVMVSHNFTLRPVAGIVSCARVYRPALVGETLALEAWIDDLDTAAVRYHGVARVGDEAVFELESALGPLLPMEQFIDAQQVRSQFTEIDRPGDWPNYSDGDKSSVIHFPVQRVNTHHFQFDRVVSCEPGVALCAEKRITRAAPYFPDHFPLKPVLPMTVLLECILNLIHEFLSRSALAGRYQVRELRKVKMNEFVSPGDVVTGFLQVKHHSTDELVLSCRSEVNGKRVCVVEVAMTATSEA